VPYIPNFTLNLIYVSQLIRSLTCQFFFSLHDCQILDSQSKRMISVAEVQHGPYTMTFRAKPILHNVHHFFSYRNNVWHLRFGQLSHEKLCSLKQLYPLIECNKTDFPYDFCHFSK